MKSRYLYLVLLFVLVPFVLIACNKEVTPERKDVDFNEKEDLKPKEPKRTVFVYINPSSGSIEREGSRVLVPAGTDGSQTIAIGSASFYDWLEDVKKRFAREKLESANEDCVLIEKIARNNPEHLDIEGKVDLKCVDINTEEPSHTDPSPIDGVDEWVLCQPSDSGPGSSGPGGSPGGPGAGPGSGPADPGVGPGGDSGGDEGGEDTGSGSDTVDAMVEILCTPAVRVNPGVDPRFIYPAPDQVEAVVANIAPCAGDFCPYEFVFEVPELEDPTDPIDPSQDEPEELTEDIRGQLMCDSFRGLCDRDVTLISKGDLAKDDDDEIEGDPEGTCDGVCDGVCNKADGTSSPGESCEHGPVGSETETWISCGPKDGVKGSVCVKHEKVEGKSEYTVSHGNGTTGNLPSPEEQIIREDDAKAVIRVHGGERDCSLGDIQVNQQNKYQTSFNVTCK